MVSCGELIHLSDLKTHYWEHLRTLHGLSLKLRIL